MAALTKSDEARLTDALELGWRMAELNAQVDDLGEPVGDSLLPAHDSLPRPDQLELQVRAAAGDARRSGARRGSEALEDLADQAREVPTSEDNGDAFRDALLECHIVLTKDLWAQHEAAGKAYELGNSVSDTFNRVCRAYRQHAPGREVSEEAQGPLRDEWCDVFREYRIEKIKKLLDDLQSRLDPSGVAVVSDHLDTWSARVRKHMERKPSLPNLAQVRDVLRRQTIIWRQLLAGAKQPEAYLNRQQRAEVPGELRKLLGRRLRSWTGVAIFAVVGLVVFALLNLDSVSSWFDHGWFKGLAGAVGGAAGLLGINRASAALAVRNRFSQWSQLLWNRALAKKVRDVTLTVDEVFPSTDGAQCRFPRIPPEELELLREHRPLLQYSQDPFRICSAQTIVETKGNALRRPDGSTVAVGAGLSLDSLSANADSGEYLEATRYSETEPPPLQDDPGYAHRVYGRVVDDGRSGKWLQYWFWIYFNQKRLLGLGSHEGDWEMIQIHLGQSREPDGVTFAQHDHGDARRWGPDQGMRLKYADGRERIVVFVAPFSHASYYSPGTKFYAGGTDSPDELGPLELSEVEPFGVWASWPGRWGGSRARMGTSPHGPACQGAKWANPDRYHALQRGLKPWQRVLKAVWVAGHLTYPRRPNITATIDGTVVRGTFAKKGLIRRGRHLYLSAHSVENRRLVGGPSIEKHVGGSGRFELELRSPLDRCLVHATAYNRFRQTSDPATVEAARSR